MVQLAIFPTIERTSALGQELPEVFMHVCALKVGETILWRIIMRGDQPMVSVRNVAVFIALVGLLFGLASVGEAAQQRKSQARHRAAGEREITGRVGAPEMVLRGPVASVDPSTGFLVMRRGTGSAAEEIPVEVDAKTTLMRTGQRVTLDAVRPGDRVAIHYSGQPGDVAKTVDVTPGRGASARATKARGGRSKRSL
jgi:hypothetical protein